MSNAETTQLVLELKEQEQDYEFYPTTKEIIACIHEHINSHWEIEHYSTKCLTLVAVQKTSENILKNYTTKENCGRKMQAKDQTAVTITE